MHEPGKTIQCTGKMIKCIANKLVTIFIMRGGNVVNVANVYFYST